jgi:hypothetical protein
MEVTLEAGPMAQSLFRVFSGCCVLAGDWEGLSLEDQARWYAVATGGARKMQELEGETLADAGQKLAAIFAGGEGVPEVFSSPPGRLAWEAVARQLWLLIDCDEVGTFEDGEAMCVSVFRKKIGLLKQAG